MGCHQNGQGGRSEHCYEALAEGQDFITRNLLARNQARQQTDEPQAFAQLGAYRPVLFIASRLGRGQRKPYQPKGDPKQAVPITELQRNAIVFSVRLRVRTRFNCDLGYGCSSHHFCRRQPLPVQQHWCTPLCHVYKPSTKQENNYFLMLHDRDIG